MSRPLRWSPTASTAHLLRRFFECYRTGPPDSIDNPRLRFVRPTPRAPVGARRVSPASLVPHCLYRPPSPSVLRMLSNRAPRLDRQSTSPVRPTYPEGTCRGETCLARLVRPFPPPAIFAMGSSNAIEEGPPRLDRESTSPVRPTYPEGTCRGETCLARLVRPFLSLATVFHQQSLSGVSYLELGTPYENDHSEPSRRHRSSW